MTSTAIKVFSNTRLGAPVVSNNWGDLTNMLDACLINGYNSQPILASSGTGTEITSTVPLYHGFQVGDSVTISNATLAPPIQNPLNSGATFKPSALLHFNGSNNSTVFTDACGADWGTYYGAPVISTAQSKIGGASALFNAKSAISSTSNNYIVDTNDFSIECHVRFVIANTPACVIDIRNSDGSTGINLSNNGSGGLLLTTPNGSLVSSTNVVTSTWYHIAIVRSAGVVSLYLNGTSTGTSYTDVSSITANSIVLGANAYGAVFFSGYIDEFLFINGAAKYTSNFTAPTTAYAINTYAVSSTTPSGETVISNETHCLSTVSNPVITWQPLAGTTGYKVWKGSGSQLETAYFSVSSGTTTFTDTGSAGTSASLPTGVSQSSYNGEFVLTGVTSTSVTFLLSGTVNFSGIIKIAPLGFTTVYTGTNKRVYKSSDLTSTGNLLRVDNSLDTAYTTTYAKYAKVTVCDAMSDIDTFTTTNRMPYNASFPTLNEKGTGSSSTGFNGWFKWYHSVNGAQTQSSGDAGPTNTVWTIIGNSKLFYIIINQYLLNTYTVVYAFGDIQSFRAGDSYSTFLLASDCAGANNTPTNVETGIARSYYVTPSTVTNGVGGDPVVVGGGGLLKSYNGYNSWVSCAYHSALCSQGALSGSTSQFYNGPNDVDSSLIVSPIHCIEVNGTYTNNVLRGIIPGLYHLPQKRFMANGSIVSNVIDYPSKKFMIINVINNAQIAFDINGPWS